LWLNLFKTWKSGSKSQPDAFDVTMPAKTEPYKHWLEGNDWALPLSTWPVPHPSRIEVLSTRLPLSLVACTLCWIKQDLGNKNTYNKDYGPRKQYLPLWSLKTCILWNLSLPHLTIISLQALHLTRITDAPLAKLGLCLILRKYTGNWIIAEYMPLPDVNYENMPYDIWYLLAHKEASSNLQSHQIYRPATWLPCLLPIALIPNPITEPNPDPDYDNDPGPNCGNDHDDTTDKDDSITNDSTNTDNSTSTALAAQPDDVDPHILLHFAMKNLADVKVLFNAQPSPTWPLQRIPQLLPT